MEEEDVDVVDIIGQKPEAYVKKTEQLLTQF